MDSVRKEQFDALFEGLAIISDGTYVMLHDCKSQLTRWSQNAVRMFNLPGEYCFSGEFDWTSLVHVDDRAHYEMCMTALSRGESLSCKIKYRVRIHDGTYVSCTHNALVMKDDKGEMNFIGGSIKNNEILHRVDPVTGLKNQYCFFDDLSTVIQNREARDLLLIGINHFSQINDMHGYNYGNRVLQNFAQLCTEIFDSPCHIYRLDGPKCLVMCGPGEGAAQAYADLQQRLYDGFYVDNVRCNISVNGCLFAGENFSPERVKEDPGTLSINTINVNTVLACLNYGYQQSKNNKHGDLVRFQTVFGQNNRVLLEKVNTIRDCVLENCKGFYLCYQPIVNVHTEHLVAMEALLRWHGEPYGEVPPYHFLPILEQDPLFVELGYWILRQALSDGVKILQRYHDIIINVNLAYIQLEKDDFEEQVLRILREEGFPPGNLCLEITESCRLVDMGRLLDIVTSLRKVGIRFAIDDFGTGYASIDILKKVPADVVKIDREFIKNIEANQRERDTVRYIAELTALYGESICAEGVENYAMRDILRHYRINTVQGFLYSKPVPLEQFMQKNFH